VRPPDEGRRARDRAASASARAHGGSSRTEDSRGRLRGETEWLSVSTGKWAECTRGGHAPPRRPFQTCSTDDTCESAAIASRIASRTRSLRFLYARSSLAAACAAAVADRPRATRPGSRVVARARAQYPRVGSRLRAPVLGGATLTARRVPGREPAELHVVEGGPHRGLAPGHRQPLRLTTSPPERRGPTAMVARPPTRPRSTILVQSGFLNPAPPSHARAAG
jgi:hypothetical protein